MARDYSISKDVCAWLPGIIEDEHWFGDGQPTWKQAQSSIDARREREKSLKRLRRRPKDYFLRPIIARLNTCRAQFRCYSGACPECTRALQRFFANEIDKLDIELVCTSIISETVPAPGLKTIDPIAMHSRMKRLLTCAGVSFGVGGTDFSFNTDLTERCEAHWSIHYWLFLPARHRSDWEPALRAFYSRTICTPVPVKIQAFDGDLRAAAYALKNTFKQRQSYVQTKTGNTQRRNTRERPIPISQFKELAYFLDKWGLCSRLFMFGVDINNDDQGTAIISGVTTGDKNMLTASSSPYDQLF